MPNFITASGSGIYYRDWGSGRPVVLVGGWPLSGDVWQPQALFLADHGYRVLHGLRRTCPDDLGVLIEGLDLYEVSLVGYATGCEDVAAYVNAHGRRRIAQIVLISPSAALDGAQILDGDLDGHRDRLNSALLDLLGGYSVEAISLAAADGVLTGRGVEGGRVHPPVEPDETLDDPPRNPIRHGFQPAHSGPQVPPRLAVGGRGEFQPVAELAESRGGWQVAHPVQADVELTEPDVLDQPAGRRVVRGQQGVGNRAGPRQGAEERVAILARLLDHLGAAVVEQPDQRPGRAKGAGERHGQVLEQAAGPGDRANEVGEGRGDEDGVGTDP